MAETGSTNSDLAQAAQAEAGEIVLVADHQTAGRGRLDRTWEAPAGASLLMSVLVRPGSGTAAMSFIPMALGLAACDSIRRVGGVAVGLKWPNDVVAAEGSALDRKLGGMLSEVGSSEAGPFVVAGLGVNLNRPGGFEGELRTSATAIDLMGGAADREELVVELLRGFETNLASVRDEAGRRSLRANYASECVTLGRRVRVELGGDEVVGTAVDVDDELALKVESDDRSVVTVRTGDVVHLRPA